MSDKSRAKAFSNHNPRISDQDRAKFASDGSARYFPGATILCHLRDDDGPRGLIHRVIVENCFDVAKPVLSSTYIRLPESSLHMTLLDVAIYADDHSRTPGATTGHVDMEEFRAAEMIRLRQAFVTLQPELQKELPIKMEVDHSTTRYPRNAKPLKVPVKPCDEGDANRLRVIRSMLRSAFSMPPLDPPYDFHVTVYYALETLSEGQLLSLQTDWSESMKRISEAAPTFEIDRIELCSFDDMCHFDVVESVPDSSDIKLNA